MNPARDQLEHTVKQRTCESDQIGEKRQRIALAILDQSLTISQRNFRCLANHDIQLLMQLYDQQFFDGMCQQTMLENRDVIHFRVSNRMTSVGGKTTVEMTQSNLAKCNRTAGKPNLTPPRKFEIAISAILLFGTTFETSAGSSTERLADVQSPNAQANFQIAGQPDSSSRVRVAGLSCVDRLDALLRIFEHELLHLIEFLVWHDSSCSARRFREIAFRLFGHRQSNHQLFTPREAAELSQGIAVGDYVGFCHAGHQYMGYVNHIHRRATVLVPHQKGVRYVDGKRYAKFYVPLRQLQRLST